MPLAQCPNCGKVHNLDEDEGMVIRSGIRHVAETDSESPERSMDRCVDCGAKIEPLLVL